MTRKHEELMARIYPVKLAVRRLFLRGPLAGIEFADTVRFVSRQRAAEWLRGIRRNCRAGNLEYRLIKTEVAL